MSVHDCLVRLRIKVSALVSLLVVRFVRSWKLFCYLIDPVRIERDVPLDLRNSRIRILIRPYDIDGLLSSSGKAVVIAIAFVRTVGSVIGPFQLRKIAVLRRTLLTTRIVPFP